MFLHQSSLLSSTIKLCPSFHTSSIRHFSFISEEDRENVLRARESGKGVLTAPIRLLKTNRLGIILTFAVYKKELPSNATPHERIQATDAWHPRGSAIAELKRALNEYLSLLIGLTKKEHGLKGLIEFKWKNLEDFRQVSEEGTSPFTYIIVDSQNWQ